IRPDIPREGQRGRRRCRRLSHPYREVAIRLRHLDSQYILAAVCDRRSIEPTLESDSKSSRRHAKEAVLTWHTKGLTRRCSRRLAGLFPPFSMIKMLLELASCAL